MNPLHDRIIVKRIDPETVTSSGIVLANVKEKPDRGTVIAVGDGKYDSNGTMWPLEVKVGDIVLFSQYTGQAFSKDGIDYLTMRESDVIGLIDE